MSGGGAEAGNATTEEMVGEDPSVYLRGKIGSCSRGDEGGDGYGGIGRIEI